MLVHQPNSMKNKISLSIYVDTTPNPNWPVEWWMYLLKTTHYFPHKYAVKWLNHCLGAQSIFHYAIVAALSNMISNCRIVELWSEFIVSHTEHSTINAGFFHNPFNRISETAFRTIPIISRHTKEAYNLHWSTLSTATLHPNDHNSQTDCHSIIIVSKRAS